MQKSAEAQQKEYLAENAGSPECEMQAVHSCRWLPEKWFGSVRWAGDHLKHSEQQDRLGTSSRAVMGKVAFPETGWTTTVLLCSH